jgi:hypothetical protein
VVAGRQPTINLPAVKAVMAWLVWSTSVALLRCPQPYIACRQ